MAGPSRGPPSLTQKSTIPNSHLEAYGGRVRRYLQTLALAPSIEMA